MPRFGMPFGVDWIWLDVEWLEGIYIKSFPTLSDLEKPPRFLQVYLTTVQVQDVFNPGTIGFKINLEDFVPGLYTCLYMLPLASNTSPIL